MIDQQKIVTTRPLSSAQISEYHAEGFVIVPGFFDPEELESLKLACEEDPEIRGAQTSVMDDQGRVFKVASWSDLSDTMLGVIPRMARVVDASEALLGQECYHWHSKIVRKQPHTESVVGFHQDYWFWYNDGCLFPDILTCTIAVDKHTKNNGCLQVVKKSHLMGRIDQFKCGNDYCTDPSRVEKILERLEMVHCEMEMGDVLFLHGNTLHWSDVNHSDMPRTILHCTYNAVSNAPFRVDGQEHHIYKPLYKLPDSVLKDGKYDSVFEKHKFHNKETDENRGTGIFRRPANQGLTTSEAID
jgi:ectoine hydroxylase-related dioxygenase (phytanoyl-CoA dioxygenase family)